MCSRTAIQTLQPGGQGATALVQSSWRPQPARDLLVPLVQRLNPIFLGSVVRHSRLVEAVQSE